MGMTTITEQVRKINEALSFLVNSEIIQIGRVTDTYTDIKRNNVFVPKE